MNQGGLPHSEISGSKPVCGSPKLIAAYHVLHRLLAPRHSPYALSSLTIRTRTHAAGQWSVASWQHALRHAAHCRPPTDHYTNPEIRTACAWSENYRLQDIQLSKIADAYPLRLETSRILAAPASCRTPWLATRACPFARTPSARVSSLRAASAQPSRTRAKAGGEYRARTGDLLVANQALSQLS